MAHGERAERIGHISREYWSKRPGSMSNWGRTSKAYTHRMERVLAKRETSRVLRAVQAGDECASAQSPTY